MNMTDKPYMIITVIVLVKINYFDFRYLVITGDGAFNNNNECAEKCTGV